MRSALPILGFVCFAGVVQAELLTGNHGFEYGNTSEWMQWASGSGTSWSDTFESIADGTAIEGDYYGRLGFQDSGPWWGFNVAWVGEAPPIAADGSSALVLSSWYRSTNATHPILRIEAFGPGGFIDAAEAAQPITLDGTWQPVSLRWTPPPGTTHVTAAVGATGSSFSLDIDDVSMVAVPEPATMILLGLGGLWLRRRISS